MAEPTTQDAGIAALEALSEGDAAPEVQEEIVDPIVAAAKTAAPEANIEPEAQPVVHRPVTTKPPLAPPTRLDMAQTNLKRAQAALTSAQQEVSDAALAEQAALTTRQPTLVEMNALARKQQEPEAAARRAVGKLISDFGLLRRPHQTHSVIAPLPNREAKVE